MNKKLSVLSLIIILLLSCVSRINPVLENRKWYLLEIEGDRNISVVDERYPFLELDLESSKAGGYGTCNNFFTEYLLDGNSLSFESGSLNDLVCNEETKQEYRFLHALSRVDSYVLENNMLYLYEGELIVLVFEDR